jgi:hypothetical protein
VEVVVLVPLSQGLFVQAFGDAICAAVAAAGKTGKIRRVRVGLGCPSTAGGGDLGSNSTHGVACRLETGIRGWIGDGRDWDLETLEELVGGGHGHWGCRKRM